MPHAPTHPSLLGSESAAGWLQCGQAFEAAGRLAEALAAYDWSIRLTAAQDVTGDVATRMQAIAWMNRGNALQKLGGRENISSAVVAYDAAIARLARLDGESEPAIRNSLGAAWMNRGRALQLVRDDGNIAAAIACHERAIALFRLLPLDVSLAHRRNLAGASLNLADALLDSTAHDALARARDAALEALQLSAPREEFDGDFADLSLKSRRALVETLGRLLVAASQIPAAAGALRAAASDAIEDGLALARRWERQGILSFRPVTIRLFRFGAQFYRVYQPQFLAEFLLEQLVPSRASAAPFGDDSEFRRIAAETLERARAELDQPRLLHIGDATSENLLRLSREWADAARHIAALPQDAT